jgi:hypothetical protein
MNLNKYNKLLRGRKMGFGGEMVGRVGNPGVRRYHAFKFSPALEAVSSNIFRVSGPQ